MLVTALFDLSQFEANAVRRNIDFYMDHCNYVLRQKSPMVIFTEPALVDKITERRLQFLTPAENKEYTTYVVKPMQELKYFDDGTLDIIRHNWSKHPYESTDPGKMTPAYVALMWNKFEFVRQAADMFPDQQVFGWIDMAIGRVCQGNPDVGAVVAHSNPNTFSVSVLNPATREEIQNMVWYYSCWKYHVAGNFWCIGRTLLPEFLTCMGQYIAEALAAEVAGPDEEIMARFVVHRPQDCSFFFGDYGYTISNRIHFRDDAHGTNLATMKAHEKSLHHIAIAGYQTLLQAGVDDIFSLHITQVLSYTTNVYIHLYYVDREKAKEVAEFLKCMRNKHVYIMNEITARQEHYQSLFAYVNVNLADDNLEIPETLSTPWLQAIRLWIENDCHKWMRVADIPAGTDWSQVLTDNFYHFVDLQNIVAQSGSGRTGSYMSHDDDLRYEPNLFLKQQGLFDLIVKTQASSILEIGVNTGHSLLIMLLAHRFSQSKDTLKLVTFDLCECKHTQACVEYLNQHFGNVIELIPGACPGTLKQYFQDHPECHFDIYHVNGCRQWKVVWQELLLCGKQAKENDYVLLDAKKRIPHCFEAYWNPIPWQVHPDHVNSAYQVKQKFPETLHTDPLSVMADRCSSDKCPQRKHNYTPVYHSLFHDKRDRMRHVLEIGIGFPALMGDKYTTGASLYMWQEYFENAEIVGVDINRDTLIQADRIKTFFMDQGNPQTMKFLGSQDFDVIIDDGSHQKAHQILTLRETFRCLRPGGIYIIEDINVTDVDWLKESGIDANQIDCIEEYHLDPHMNDDKMLIIWKNNLPFKPPMDLTHLWQVVKPYTTLAAPLITHMVTCVRNVICGNVQGNIVEIGGSQAGGLISLIMTLQHYDQSRAVHSYNPSKHLDDDQVQNTVAILNYSPVSFHVGKIKKTQDSVAVLCVNVTAYDETWNALKQFYPHVTPGGYVIINEYGHSQGCKQAVDKFLSNRKELQLQNIDNIGIYWKKPL
jgi:SAM-dependent methyltransferase